MNTQQKLSCLTACALLMSAGKISTPHRARSADTVPQTIPRTETIAQTLASAHLKDLSTLLIVLKAAGLVSTLQKKGPFTLLAPTNAAFDKLPKGALETLLKPENKEKLVKIFSFHLLPEDDDATQLRSLKEVKTIEDDKLKIQTKDNRIVLSNDNAAATVIKSDIHCSNGTIHLIDTVLMPD